MAPNTITLPSKDWTTGHTDGYVVMVNGVPAGYVERAPLNRHVWNAYSADGHKLVGQRGTRRRAVALLAKRHLLPGARHLRSI